MEQHWVMGSKELKESDKAHYFTPAEQPSTEHDDGTRDMFPLAPFVVSGGRNTERYYFVHVNDLSEKYKFNIRPKYFGDESAYTEVFPQRIKEILSKNADAKVFCVFDMDTVCKYNLQDKHKVFVASLQDEIDNGQVVLCDSMPSFEFWLLLHFVDYEGLLKNYSEVSQELAPYIKPYFEDSTKGLKKLLKKEKYLLDSTWVRKLLEEGRIEQAVERAKNCIARVMKEEQYSYSNVFKIFE
ncbi:RloB family protein [Bacteroides faecis]|uniref:RloB family protein n=1 Tax=Bacteroides faecis TaxID=674529 RepID=A0AAW5NZ95_9BACE|nr:RloB family protein [Bacteroides faecis]MCS2793805.1 RloB family protein [Bacteroides faecis]